MREILRFAGNVIVAYQAQPLNKNSYSLVVASLLSNPIVIAGAALVVAAIILVAALLLFRSSGKKKKANAAASSDWQRQGQQAPPPGWNQQGSIPGANSWSQPGQQPNTWGAQQQPSPWDAQNPLNNRPQGGELKTHLPNSLLRGVRQGQQILGESNNGTHPLRLIHGHSREFRHGASRVTNLPLQQRMGVVAVQVNRGHNLHR